MPGFSPIAVYKYNMRKPGGSSVYTTTKPMKGGGSGRLPQISFRPYNPSIKPAPRATYLKNRRPRK